jgi:hypothetical protein
MVAAVLVRLEHPGGPAAEAAIEKQFHSTQSQPLTPHPAPDPNRAEVRKAGDRRVKENSEGQPTLALECPEGRQRTRPLDIVDSREPQPMGLPLRF